jgi:spore germination cell wall hydrolase CwlJ-like protein
MDKGMNKTTIGVSSFIVLSQLVTLYKILEVDREVSGIREVTGTLSREVKEIKNSIYKTSDKIRLSDKDRECLMKNIFHEAGVEDISGKIAVAQVTINRVNSGRWGDSVCRVVYAKAQFSWTLQKKKKIQKPKGKLWKESVIVAKEFENGSRVTGVDNSLFYHTDYIKKPYLAKTMTVSTKVGQHIFYKS